ncbi:uncharacterized protein RCC_05899 [Ramularia collo-cygni]|uniref:SCP domain-containing protein n=1 Tax=Ramularia collo-cygni TaxID=112498 RepID=A0A2D3US14_9PEZI|nr:uncharacterized protein RCC_05899 [Ramularia collo-cygni]CZT20042.1 uncharacterized protein RCC_05899 [Ramularia collo-cygni]
MRSAFAIAAFAAGAIAVPFADNKRDLEYVNEVAYVTNVVTVTAYGPAPTEPATKAPHYGHQSSKAVSHAPVNTVPAYQAPKPVYSAPAPVYSAPAPAPVSSSPSSDGGAPSGYNDAVVMAHNLHRANHSAPAVAWDKDLYDCAKTVAESCDYKHDVTAGGGGYGQNIAAGVAQENITAVISDMFYNGEEPLYAAFYGSEPDMSNFEAWGHFTQIVWKDTTHVACYTQHCPNGLANTGNGVSPYFTVCNYKGPGNYAGEYAANVLAPKGEATVDWSASAYV